MGIIAKKIGIIIAGIIVGIILFILVQIILPFPFGLFSGIVVWILVVVIFLVKALKMSASPAKSKATQTKDETQFWVCPNCGGDTQMKDGRQYCSSCKIYL